MQFSTIELKTWFCLSALEAIWNWKWIIEQEPKEEKKRMVIMVITKPMSAIARKLKHNIYSFLEQLNCIGSVNISELDSMDY
jgi:hypothetical protein